MRAQYMRVIGTSCADDSSAMAEAVCRKPARLTRTLPEVGELGGFFRCDDLLFANGLDELFVILIVLLRVRFAER